MKIRMIAAVSIAAATMLPLAAIAHADPTTTTYWIKSPSANIACILTEVSFSGTDEYGQANCDVADHTWAAPPLPPDCHFPHEPVFVLASRSLISSGQPAALDQCHAGNTSIYRSPSLQTLDYGHTRSVGAITCDSAPAGITCTDSSSGHFFRMSRDSYQLG